MLESYNVGYGYKNSEWRVKPLDYLRWLSFSYKLTECRLCVTAFVRYGNQGGTDNNRCTQRLAILRAPEEP